MAKAQKSGNKKPNLAVRFMQYIKDVRNEMKRVVWPGREEVISSSMIVIFTLVFFIFFVLIVDQISSVLIIDLLGSLGG